MGVCINKYLRLNTGLQLICAINLSIGLTLPLYADRLPGATPGNGENTVNTDSVVDDKAAGWIWRGMEEVSDPESYGGGHHAGGMGAYCSYTFHGVGVDVLALTGPLVAVDGRGHKLGRAKISIDGKVMTSAGLQNQASNHSSILYSVKDLTDDNHVVEIETELGWIDIDCIHVYDKKKAELHSIVPHKIAPSNFIVNKLNDLVLDNYNVKEKASIIHLEPYSSNLLQQQIWTFKKNGDYFTIICRQSGLALDGYQMNPGTPVFEILPNGSEYQNWEIAQVDDDSYKIVNQASGLALDNHSLGSGGQLFQEPYTGEKRQLWHINPTP